VIVVSTGLGASAKTALNAALEAAVSQALGRLIHSDTLVENDVLIREQILSATSGFVERFETMSEGYTDGLYTVRIKAEVRTDKLRAEVTGKIQDARGLDGQSLSAKIATRESATVDARQLLSDLLGRLPHKLLAVKVLRDPEAVEGVALPEGVTRLRVPIEISLDQAVWSNRVVAIKRALETVAVADRTTPMRLKSRTLSPGDSTGYGFGEGAGRALVCKSLAGADWKGAKPAAGQLLPYRVSQASCLFEREDPAFVERQLCWELFGAFDRAVTLQAVSRLNRPLETVFVIDGNIATGALSVSTYAIPTGMVEDALQSFLGKIVISVAVLDIKEAELAQERHEFTLAPARSYWSDVASAQGGNGGFRSDDGKNPSYLLAGRGLVGSPRNRAETMVVPGVFTEDHYGTGTVEFGVIHAWRGNVYLDISTSQIGHIQEVRCVLEIQ
jgi:hypothetical protein